MIYKILYVVALIIGSVGIFFVEYMSHWNPWVFLTCIILLLLPGRIQGVVWREFFMGRQLMAQKQYELGIEHFCRFLDILHQRPWMRHFIWANWGFYTRDIETMTWNNIGAAYVELGKEKLAEEALNKAMTRDPLCPLPYDNLAGLFLRGGDDEKAQIFFEKARSLGYRRSSVDQVIHRAGEALANLEGRMPSAR